jgi:hypothetical protein
MKNDLTEWITRVTGSDFVYYIKRLSGNDTLANGTHQAGPYIPKDFLLTVFPALNNNNLLNPDIRFNLNIDSHDDMRSIRAIWYNNKFHGGTRNETRLTNFGGQESALLNPENTGALTIFAFSLDNNGEAAECHVWVCKNVPEEDYAEELFGAVEPGKWKIWSLDESIYARIIAGKEKEKLDCWLKLSDIPPSWIAKFPTGADIIRKTLELRPAKNLDPDSRLIIRRNCEYEMFRSLEEAIELPWVKQGFGSIDEFIAKAQTVLQRRKSRSGRSLELHIKEIFLEEKLREGMDFSHQPESEPGKKPDFLFPSEQNYKSAGFDTEKLRMLAIKTTCKDRWRQILSEADRIRTKHLLTLQEGISENQFREMITQNVQLVVPEKLIGKYPHSVQPHLMTIKKFISEIRSLK